MPATDDAHDDLRRILADAARFLPPQGPIDSFVAQNTLQGFEPHPFEEAVVRAARFYGAQPFLPESTYRAELARGRITVADLDAVLTRDLGDHAARPLLGGRTTLGALERVLLLHAVRQESDDAVRWTLAESDALRRLRPDLAPAARHRLLTDAAPEAGRPAADEQRVAAELWHACVEATAFSRPAVVHTPPPVRYRELILAVDPTLDTDALVHPPLIRLVAAFLDQGVAAWPMPDRDAGLLGAVAGLYAGGPGPLAPWGLPLTARFRAIAARSPPAGDELALDVIAAELAALGVPRASQADFIAASLVALRGWAAMIHQLELRPDRTPVRRLPVRLADFLALRLLLDRAAVTWAVQRLAGTRPDARAAPHLAAWWTELRDRHPPRRGPGTLARAFLLHQVAQLLGLGAADLRAAGENELLELEHAIAGFDSVARRRLFHVAYERRHATTVLDGLAAQPAVAPADGGAPRVQAIFCIDERCESLRRHLEETSPDVETFGTAGFFAVPMYYRGIDDWHTVPLCPIVMRPGHTVHEVPEDDDARSRQRFRQALRRALGRLRGGMSSGSRTLLRGGLLTSIGGAVAALPLVARVAAPRLTALVERQAADLGRRRIRTRLQLEHAGDAPLPDGTRPGFDIGEMAGMVRRLLEDIGLTTGFARLVTVVGHGSTSLNNPHESAYDCGACGGGRGGPNARAFALMANHPAVRAELAAAGLVIPADTVFVGGMQDTCTSHLRWFDVERVPPGHAAEFAEFRAACRLAGQFDAQERCRRFASVPLDVSPADAKRAVEGRAADLAQVRPEYGHASNAVCVVGRRARTRGLFLDRRAFLVSYDPAADADGRILERTLAAVGPVAGGINLAYLFSRIDPIGYGAGTKLPHNITGLIGVMDGHVGDLRTGLPLQGVEIHEPVRLLMVVEARPARILEVLERLPAVRTLMVNGWIRLVAWDPQSGRLALHDPTRAAGFVPYEPEARTIPVVERSVDWYRGHRDHLPPARLLAGRPPAAPPRGGSG